MRRLSLGLWISCGLLLAVAAVSSLILYRLHLRQPDGRFGVGVVVIRIDMRPVSGEPLRLETPRPSPSVSLWYPIPAHSGASQTRRGSWLARLHARISGRALIEAPIAPSPRKFPVLVYSTEWGGTGIDNRHLIEELVSNGFVVAGVDYPGDSTSAMLRQPMDWSSPAAAATALRRADERVRTRAADARSVLDRLTALNARDPAGRFTGRLDLQRVGIFGLSLGGAVAAEACWLDTRFKAAMNMDGWLFSDVAVQGIAQPYLLATGDDSAPSAASLGSNDPWVRLQAQYTVVDGSRLEVNFRRHGGYLLVIPGAAHEDFSDAAWGLLRIPTLPGGSRPAPPHTAALVAVYTLAFFRKTLAGENSVLFDGSNTKQFGARLLRWPAPQSQSERPF